MEVLGLWQKDYTGYKDDVLTTMGFVPTVGTVLHTVTNL